MEKIAKGINYLKQNDLVIAGIIEKENRCDLKPSRTYFKNLVRSIISQQLSSKAANTIYRRFVTKIGNKVIPQNIINLEDIHFREAGISKQKMNYLIELSKIYIKDEKFFRSLSKHTNTEIINELTKIKGVGLWTAQMFLMFSVNRLDVLPLDDIGIQNSIKMHYKLKGKPDKKKIIKIAKNWGEYSSIACWYLWESLDNRK